MAEQKERMRIVCGVFRAYQNIEFDPDEFGYIIIDEASWNNKSYERYYLTLNRFYIRLTATPYRTDGITKYSKI